ncbi:GGDEF domain-containing protein [Eoetvoesiella caeni]|uniref:diguanylate cyclase n=1 Tax=Eoetvoesiella caeni TaxID=645616 RepID=A0A366H158_9BURK|nr:GGDEF domain-containing protein [Eoetvoesiella caeni]MCI2810877.1 GGDEF domain-containing protein [Eoetvoesiella caeni]NYT56824.1 GGDEF domain-containing protein [Eoetvoesiella caeni]RBP35622.1 diguanylate cyclase (GGDEF)-like protein [Eoetvoesiella caeni]
MNGMRELRDEPNLKAEVLQSIYKKLMTGLETSRTLVVLYDEHDVVRYANPAFRKVFMHGLNKASSFESIIRTNHEAGTGVLIRGHEIDSYLAFAREHRRTTPHRKLSVDLVDGRRLWITETLLEDSWLLSEAMDTTAMKQAETSLRVSRDVALVASQTDFLTKLPNRRSCFTFLERALTFAQANNKELSVAMLDLDYFKTVNDSFGHNAGDTTLCRFANILRSNVRTSDLVARIGGEEFMIVWPGATLPFALDVLKRLQESTIDVELPGHPTKLRITFSAGVTQTKPEDTAHSLVSRADKYLYIAKAHGRNTIKADED